MRTKEEILEDFEPANYRSEEADKLAQKKILIEVLCDIRDILFISKEGGK